MDSKSCCSKVVIIMAVFRIYKDSISEYRWRLRAANNKIIADSGEGYINKQDAIDGINFVRVNAPDANIEDLTQS